MLNSVAYWISPRGDVLSARTRHLDDIRKYPEKFGYTQEMIKAIYDEHGERLGIEGKAREDILNDLIRQGWIRMRRYPNRFWSVNVNRLSGRMRDNIWDFFVKVTEEGIDGFIEKDINMDVNISELSGGASFVTKKYTVDDIRGTALFTESIRPMYRVKSAKYEDLPDIPVRLITEKSLSTSPKDFLDRQYIVCENTLSGGISHNAGSRKNTYKIGDTVRFKNGHKREEGIVEAPYTSDGKMVVVLGSPDDPKVERVAVDPDFVELVDRPVKSV
jgi:hypothetical protein